MAHQARFQLWEPHPGLKRPHRHSCALRQASPCCYNPVQGFCAPHPASGSSSTSTLAGSPPKTHSENPLCVTHVSGTGLQTRFDRCKRLGANTPRGSLLDEPCACPPAGPYLGKAL